MKTPHLLIATSNVHRLRSNLDGVLDASGKAALENEHIRNVVELYRLGANFFEFAKSLDKAEWRNTVSRCYYGAYNMRRAVQLWVTGRYSTDSTDHQKAGVLPDDFPRAIVFSRKLKDLREDRNACDYDHEANINDLLFQDTQDIIQFVSEFQAEVVQYLRGKGVKSL